MMTETMLAATLEHIGVHFVANQANSPVKTITTPDILLIGLASSNEARMRLALIPLFLSQPHYAQYVTKASNHLTPAQQHLLHCYYTAAQLLQQKYQPQLAELLGNHISLPPFFSSTLGLNDGESPDIRLRQLAKRQAQLSGKAINWYGTYEHAYERLVRHAKKRKQWQQ